MLTPRVAAPTAAFPGTRWTAQSCSTVCRESVLKGGEVIHRLRKTWTKAATSGGIICAKAMNTCRRAIAGGRCLDNIHLLCVAIRPSARELQDITWIWTNKTSWHLRVIHRRNSHFIEQERQPLLKGAKGIYPKETMANSSKMECWSSPHSINMLSHLAGQQFQQHVFFGGTLGDHEGGAMYTLVSSDSFQDIHLQHIWELVWK